MRVCAVGVGNKRIQLTFSQLETVLGVGVHVKVYHKAYHHVKL